MGKPWERVHPQSYPLEEKHRLIYQLGQRVVTDVIKFPNGMVAVCDQFGEQIPELQGPYEKVITKIRWVYSGPIQGE